MMPKLIALARRRTSARHALDRHAEHLGRRHGVDVETFREGMLQLRDVGHVREHAQLDLAVVGGDQLLARLGDEGACGSRGLPRCGSGCSAGSARSRKPPGRGRGERISRYGCGRSRVDVAGSDVRIGGLQLGKLPPLEQFEGMRR